MNALGRNCECLFVCLLFLFPFKRTCFSFEASIFCANRLSLLGCLRENALQGMTVFNSPPRQIIGKKQHKCFFPFLHAAFFKDSSYLQMGRRMQDSDAHFCYHAWKGIFLQLKKTTKMISRLGKGDNYDFSLICFFKKKSVFLKNLVN